MRIIVFAGRDSGFWPDTMVSTNIWNSLASETLGSRARFYKRFSGSAVPPRFVDDLLKAINRDLAGSEN